MLVPVSELNPVTTNGSHQLILFALMWRRKAGKKIASLAALLIALLCLFFISRLQFDAAATAFYQ